MSASRRADVEIDKKTGQPKNKTRRRQMEKAHGHYSASDAKEGRKGRLPSSPAPGQQPRPATPRS
jgi:hypothetical protein